MGDDLLPDSANTQTQTQNSQIDWSQHNTPSYIPTIWGRLYSTKVGVTGKHCWNNAQYPEYYGENISLVYSLLINLKDPSTFKYFSIRGDLKVVLVFQNPVCNNGR